MFWINISIQRQKLHKQHPIPSKRARFSEKMEDIQVEIEMSVGMDELSEIQRSIVNVEILCTKPM